MSRAKELEKKYEWLQAAKLYTEASELASEEKDHAKASELQEQTGYCFYRAAFQAQTNSEFKKRMKQAIEAYETELLLLEEANTEEKQIGITHAQALAAYTRSWLQTNPTKKKELLDEWWTLENQTLSRHERAGNTNSVAKVCNDLMEYSFFHRHLLVSTRLENEKISKEMLSLVEKAIKTISDLKNNHEKARAYCFASIYKHRAKSVSQSEERRKQLDRESKHHSDKSLEISKITGNEWLIAWSYMTAYMAETSISTFSETALEISKKIKKSGAATKDKFFIATGNSNMAITICMRTLISEDPDKLKESLKKARDIAKEAIHNYQIINHPSGGPYYSYIFALRLLAGSETNPEKQQKLFEVTIGIVKEGIKLFKDWKKIILTFLGVSAELYGWHLSRIKSNLEEKKEMLLKGINYRKKAIAYAEQMYVSGVGSSLYSNMQLANMQALLAKIETDNKEKTEILKQALESAEKSIELVERRKKGKSGKWARGSLFPMAYFNYCFILRQIYSLTKEKKTLVRAIEACKSGIELLESTDLTARIAESYWNLAQLFDLLGDQQKASKNYENAAEAYNLAFKKIPQLKQFYGSYSDYMRAWSQIEQAKQHHSIEDYEKAEEHYEKAAKLHEKSEQWKYLAYNYFAWASVEKAESLSRKENTLLSKQVFQKAIKQFIKAEEDIKQGLSENKPTEEKEMIIRLCEAADLRRKYCQARVLMEDAKLLDREGKYRQSSKSYAEAADNIKSIIESVEVEGERRELELLAVLCQAWEKLGNAEETPSSESYLAAAQLFEQARKHCFTRKASLWVLGNSNFCKGLAAGTKYQGSMDLKDNALAKRYIKSAATSYLQAGFKSASEYAKATQRLFDAYVFMNQAESEVNPENKTKQYQMAEKLLQISAGSFMKAKQPEKTAQVQQMLETVGEEKTLAASLNEVMHAPALTSSTLSFTAPSPTSEASVGLEKFEHANVQANLVAGMKEVRVGESLCLSVEFVNAGKEPALLTRVEDFVPPSFVVVKKPEIYRLEDSALNMKGKQIAPLKLVEVKVVLQPSKKGLYQLNPKVHYLDENGQNRLLQLKSIEIKVEEVILSNRVSTGTKELDALLLGGIPEECAVVLTGSPTDERELVIKNFLQAGAGEGETSFYAATEADGVENLLQKPNFYLFLCNPRPKVKVPDLPNVYKLHSKADINNLNIALLKAYRTVEQSSSKRICVNIVSDVLANYTVKTTRKWIAELTTDLISKGFTILAVINPLIHTTEELNNLLELFDGEINLTQTEDPLECKKSLRVKKLRNQDYIKNPICLTKQR